MALSLPELYAAEKSALPSGWAEDERGRQHVQIGLEIGGTSIEGLFLRGTAHRSLPDREVMFQLEYRPPYRTGDQLARIDWRPMRPHVNGAIGPRELQFLRIPGTHQHAFDLNWQPDSGAMRLPNLPVARPISPDPINFHQLIALVSSEFRIGGLKVLPVPSWDLLL